MLQVQSLDSVKILSVDYNALIKGLKKACHKIKINHPETLKLLLFGSFSKGDYTPESDIDILIIVRQTDIPFLERRDMFLDFFKDIPFDLNILVYTEAELKKMLGEGNPFIQRVMKETREL